MKNTLCRMTGKIVLPITAMLSALSISISVSAQPAGTDLGIEEIIVFGGLDPVGQTSEDIDCVITNCTVSRATVPQRIRVGVSYKF